MRIPKPTSLLLVFVQLLLQSLIGALSISTLGLLVVAVSLPGHAQVQQQGRHPGECEDRDDHPCAPEPPKPPAPPAPTPAPTPTPAPAPVVVQVPVPGPMGPPGPAGSSTFVVPVTIASGSLPTLVVGGSPWIVSDFWLSQGSYLIASSIDVTPFMWCELGPWNTSDDDAFDSTPSDLGQRRLMLWSAVQLDSPTRLMVKCGSAADSGKGNGMVFNMRVFAISVDHIAPPVITTPEN